MNYSAESSMDFDASGGGGGCEKLFIIVIIIIIISIFKLLKGTSTATKESL